MFREKVESAQAGNRVALNLHGAELEGLAVGQVVARPGTIRATRLFDAELSYLDSRKRPQKSGGRAVVHAGTAHAEATVTLLDADVLEPGQTGMARFRLRAPLALVPGERLSCAPLSCRARRDGLPAGAWSSTPSPAGGDASLNRRLPCSGA